MQSNEGKGKCRFRYWCILVLLLAFLGGNFTAQRVQAKGETYDDLRIFSEVLSLVQKKYVEEVKGDELVRGAIAGMLRTLDPHSSYMSPDIFKEMQVETEGSFGGLGIEITLKDEQLTVVSPIEGTPADEAGIKAGDRILKVNGESTRDFTLLEAVKRMRGPAGTKVILTILREGFTETKDFELTRAIIKIKSVKWKMRDDGIGYVRLSSFNKTSTDELEKSLEEMEKKKMTGLVLDLRNNPGGLLDQAVKVTELFLKKGDLIVYTKGRSDDQNLRFVAGGKKSSYQGFPMVVLVNEGSASASEIVSGALQDLGRAVILGTKTFGKGSVQTIIPLSDGSGLRLTTAKYYTPKGRSIQEKGIAPDIFVENPPIDRMVKLEGPKEGPKHPQIIREKDLQRHLGGEPEKESDNPTGKEVKDKPAKEGGDEESDLQLQRAHDLLKGLTIFKKILVTSLAEK
ncbi:MAG: S41 family peptidase [Nitrospinae bacterium]|nr:S41 family peptidase [Nitrospinota bacterium]